ncbi:MAG: helix-turn-helix domain-containing protein [Acidimicrobiales bacterium]
MGTRRSPDTSNPPDSPTPWGTGRPTYAQALARPKRILDATEAELVGHGHHQLTVRGIADRAGCSTATLYRHWQPGNPRSAGAGGTTVLEVVLTAVAERHVARTRRRLLAAARQATAPPPPIEVRPADWSPTMELLVAIVAELVRPTAVHLTRAAADVPSVAARLGDQRVHRTAALETVLDPERARIADAALLGLVHPVVALHHEPPAPGERRRLVAPLARHLDPA